MAKLAEETLKRKHHGVFNFEFDDSGRDAGGEGKSLPSTIHLIPIGQWDHDLYGPIIITASDIKQFKQNFDAGIRKGVYITAGHEGYAELPALAWLTAVEAREDGLWGTPEWNELGKSTLLDKQFKFFSPEFYPEYADPETHEIYKNVLTGGALTKSPYFKELEAVVFSDKNIKQFNDKETMNLNDILAKAAADITTLSDEEKAFLVAHKEELTDEQKTTVTAIIDVPETPEEKQAREEKERGDANEAAGLNRDGSAKTAPVEPKVEGSTTKMVQMSELEVNILRAKADQGSQAFAELGKTKLNTAVSALVFNEKTNVAGLFLPKSEAAIRTFMEKLDDGQRKQFADLCAAIPGKQIFKEVGSDKVLSDGSAALEVDTKINALMASDKSLTYSSALKKVMSEDAGLAERYDTELPSVKGKRA